MAGDLQKPLQKGKDSHCGKILQSTTLQCLECSRHTIPTAVQTELAPDWDSVCPLTQQHQASWLHGWSLNPLSIRERLGQFYPDCTQDCLPTMAGPRGAPQDFKTVPRQSLWESDSCCSLLNFHKSLFSKDFVLYSLNFKYSYIQY